MTSIFKFTFRQHTASRSYRVSTVIVAVLLLTAGYFGFFIADLVMGSEKVSDITRVMVCDSSVLSGTDYNVLHESGNENYKNVVFENSDLDVEKTTDKLKNTGTECVLEVTNDEKGGFKLRLIKPEGFEAEKKSASHLSSFIESGLRYVIYESAGLSAEQKQEMMRRTAFEISVAGEDGGSLGDEMAKNIIPLLLGVFMYIMLCMYGQGVARCIVVEKDSKMMESLLVMTKPYDLIFGKILGMYLAAVVQIALWLAAAVTGVMAGISSTASGSKVSDFFAQLSVRGGFSAGAVAVGIISLLVGFLLYIALAAFTGSFASKTEEINNYFGIYTMVVVICWMFPYMNQLNGNDHMLGILRYIPFSATFMVPADVVIGNTGIVTGIISIAVSAAATVAVVYLAAKVYKALVLYRGEPVKIKDVFKIIKSK